MNDIVLGNSNQLVQRADPAAVAAAEIAKTRLQAAYQVAMARPRNQEQARQNLLSACRRLKFAEKAEYNKPVGGNSIVGPSIRFAETALREWGNVRSDISVVYEDDWVRRVQINIIDFETNAQFTKEVTVKKTVERRFANDRQVIGERQNSRGEKVFIVLATDDEIANKEAAMISKAVRNEGLRLIPGDIVEEALEVARETISKNVREDPEAGKRKVIDAFGGIGIKVKDLEAYLGHSIGSCSPAEIVELRSVYSSIRDGEASWKDYMETRKGEQKDKSAAEALAEAAASKKKPKPVKAEPKPEPEPEPEADPEEPEVTPLPEARDPVQELKKACDDAKIVWDVLEEWAKASDRKMDPNTHEDAVRILNAWTTISAALKPKQKEDPEEKPMSKGEMIAEIMYRLKKAKRDQDDLIKWAKLNRHVEEAETIQDFPTHLMGLILAKWDNLVF